MSKTRGALAYGTPSFPALVRKLRMLPAYLALVVWRQVEQLFGL